MVSHNRFLRRPTGNLPFITLTTARYTDADSNRIRICEVQCIQTDKNGLEALQKDDNEVFYREKQQKMWSKLDTSKIDFTQENGGCIGHILIISK